MRDEYQLIKPLISEEEFLHLPIISRITHQELVSVSCLGLSKSSIDLRLYMLLVPEFLTLELSVYREDKEECYLGQISIEPCNKYTTEFLDIKLNAGWYNRNYKLVAKVPGLEVNRTLLSFQLNTNGYVIFDTSHYLQDLKESFYDLRRWESSLSIHLNLPISHDWILNRSGIHNLLVMYYLSHSEQVKDILNCILKSVMEDITDHTIDSLCSKAIHPKYSSPHMVYDLIKELEPAIMEGYIDIDELIDKIINLSLTYA